MENNLTPRTYLTPTCTLIVSSQEQQRSPVQQPQPTDFSLHLDSPDGGELDRITLVGQPQQLECLHQIVSQYIADTIAKFPLPTIHPNIPPAPSEPARIEIAKTSLSDPSHPDLEIASSRLGILKNLPGLRNSLAKFGPTTNKNLQSDLDSKPSISKLISGGNNPIDRTGHPDEIAQHATSSSASQDAAATPYLTGTGNRSADHQLYLGNLVTPTSGEVLTLSAIQLFDLATVLEEYVAEHLTASDPRDRPAILSRANIPDRGNRAALSTTAFPRRLPNLPNIPAAPAVSQVYYQTQRSQSSFISAIPWAVAAALVIGVPLLLLDPNPNSSKDAASKLNMPGLTGSQKSDPAAIPGITATAPTVNLPPPWQAQPVSPPPVRLPDPSVQIPENPSQIGLAPLPDAIAPISGDLPMTVASSGNITQSIVPNPLNSALQPSANNPIDNTTRRSATSPPATAIPSKTSAGQPGLTVTASPNKGANSGKLSISQRPIFIPSSDLPPIVNPPNTPIPFNPPVMELPSGQNPQTPKKANQKVQPAPVASQPNPVPTETGVIPSPSFEPITPVPRNPNLINPDQINIQSAEPQNPPIVPDKPLQSNASGAFAEGAESAALQEVKRYFQGKWKPSTTQANSLQYVLQVSGKSGIVRTISPQGAAATAYLQQTKFIKPGQKLISPAAAGSSDQKIRVLLQPDGNVDTFTEP